MKPPPPYGVRTGFSMEFDTLLINHPNTGNMRQIQTLIKFLLAIPQPEITCSKLTIETLEQGVKYVQS